MDCSLNSSSVKKKQNEICKGRNEVGKKKKTSFSTCANLANKTFQLSPSPQHTFCDNQFTDVQT